MPLWLAQVSHASRLGVSYFDLLAALETGGFSWRYRQLCAAWSIEADVSSARGR